MRVLVFIWILAILTGAIAVSFVNASINELIVQAPQAGNHLVTGQQIQPASRVTIQAVARPAATINPQANQTGGNGQNQELQPAMGYGVLGETIQ